MPPISKEGETMQSTINGVTHNIKPYTDLRGADLHNAIMTFAEVNNSDLRRVDLSNARSRFANYERCNMQQSTLFGADIRNVKMRGVKLAESNMAFVSAGYADMRGADLTGVNLQSADLHDADLTGAIIKETNFNMCNIDGVKGLLVVQHPNLHHNGVALYAVKHPATSNIKRVYAGLSVEEATTPARVWVKIGAHYFNIADVTPSTDFDGVNTAVLMQIKPIIEAWGL